MGEDPWSPGDPGSWAPPANEWDGQGEPPASYGDGSPWGTTADAQADTAYAAGGLPGAAPLGSVVISDLHATSTGTRLRLTFILQNNAGFTFDPGDAIFEVHLSPLGTGAQENVVTIPNVHALNPGESHPVVDMEADPGDYTIDLRVIDGETRSLSGTPLRLVYPVSHTSHAATHVAGVAPTRGDPGPAGHGVGRPEITRVEHVGAAADGTHEYRTHYFVRNEGAADIPPGLEVSITATGPDSIPAGQIVRPQAEQTFRLQVGVPAGRTGPERYLTLNLLPDMTWRIVVSAGGMVAQADVALDAVGAVVGLSLVA